MRDIVFVILFTGIFVGVAKADSIFPPPSAMDFAPFDLLESEEKALRGMIEYTFKTVPSDDASPAKVAEEVNTNTTRYFIPSELDKEWKSYFVKHAQPRYVEAAKRKQVPKKKAEFPKECESLPYDESWLSRARQQFGSEYLQKHEPDLVALVSHRYAVVGQRCRTYFDGVSWKMTDADKKQILDMYKDYVDFYAGLPEAKRKRFNKYAQRATSLRDAYTKMYTSDLDKIWEQFIRKREKELANTPMPLQQFFASDPAFQRPFEVGRTIHTLRASSVKK